MANSITHFLEGDKGLKIFTQRWEVENPTGVVIISHGFAEHGGRYDHVAAHFNKMGLAAIAIDHYGHGKTEGLMGHVDRYDLFLDAMQQLLDYTKSIYENIPVVLYGHSMGGNIVLNFLFKRNPVVNGVVVTGPWIDLVEEAPKLKVTIGKALRNILPRMRQATDLKETLLSTDQSVGVAYVADPLVQTKISNALGIDMLTASDYLRTYSGEVKFPLLIMHGGDDKIIDPQASEALAKRLSGPVTLKIWDGLYHEIHNEFEKQAVLNYIQEWIEANIFNQ